MSLEAGTNLGTYEIIAPIGAGGMGEVYRARDTKLGREVALKILPEDFANDPERLARFKREAQLLASLNHPNIAGIHGLEEHEDTLFLSLELVEGEDLSERLRRGPIPVEEALNIARQVADALEAAHDKGIIHRDLKPANIKLTPDGTVKVLDFGLAKALDSAEETSPELSHSPTMTRDATRAGMILGTASYMSPEQARGKVVDKRTDVWAFGCVLYEMLTGHKVFEGEDVTLTLAEVVKAEPKWDDLPAEVSPATRAALARCLKKDPKERIRDIGDAQLALEGAFEIDRAPGATDIVGKPILWATVFGIFGLAIGYILSRPQPGESDAREPRRFVVTVPQGTRTPDGSGRWRQFTISPDGSELVFPARAEDGTQQLYRRPLDAFAAVPIPGTAGGRNPVFSPDGKSLAFISALGALRKIPREGGIATAICDCDVLQAFHWGEDGTIYYGSPGTPLFRVSASGGVPEPLTTLADDDSGHRLPELLPGGRALLFTGGGFFEPRIGVHVLDTGETRVLGPGSDASYASSGHLIFQHAGVVRAARFDLTRLELLGNPIPIPGFGVVNNRAKLEFADDGTLVYAFGREGERSLLWVDRNGDTKPVVEERADYNQPRISPDAQKLAVVLDAESTDIWIYDLLVGTRVRTTTEGRNRRPAWTPDGSRIAYQSETTGISDLFWQPADGSGAPELLLERPRTQFPDAWSPDGKVLAFNEGAATRDIWMLPLGDDPEPFIATPFSERGAAFSHDGRLLAYVSNESGLDEVYVTPFPGPGAKLPISSNGGLQPVWSRRDNELFYRDGDRMMAVRVESDPLRGSPAEMLFEVSASGSSDRNTPDYDVAPDGRFVMVVAEDQLQEIRVVLNWFDELERLVPVE